MGVGGDFGGGGRYQQNLLVPAFFLAFPPTFHRLSTDFPPTFHQQNLIGGVSALTVSTGQKSVKSRYRLSAPTVGTGQRSVECWWSVSGQWRVGGVLVERQWSVSGQWSVGGGQWASVVGKVSVGIDGHRWASVGIGEHW